MRLRDFLSPEQIRLGLTATSRDDVLRELVALLGVTPADAEALHRVLLRREEIGSTGVGRGIAIPHCRSLTVNRVRLAFGHHPTGVEYGAIDARPVHDFFLIVAPPLEVSNLYLPILGRIAQFAKDPDIPERLAQLQSPEQFLALLDERGV
ncbi:MAG TPA: PTS sugar transporter subunit IIA [Gemmatimonadales bacterium]|nr:PTS sugar transporter subunit IIA [Gemmatimonadales bacterium]